MVVLKCRPDRPEAQADSRIFFPEIARLQRFVTFLLVRPIRFPVRHRFSTARRKSSFSETELLEFWPETGEVGLRIPGRCRRSGIDVLVAWRALLDDALIMPPVTTRGAPVLFHGAGQGSSQVKTVVARAFAVDAGLQHGLEVPLLSLEPVTRAATLLLLPFTFQSI